MTKLLIILLVYSITGRVVDSHTLQPLEFVNVIAENGEGTITDADGEFAITDMKDGEHELKISFVGYLPVNKKVRVRGADASIGRVLLKEDTQSLQEVEVVAQGTTMRFELDKKVFSVDQNIAAAGGSVTDALENIPAVDVDQEGNISLRNSENVEIWINGKPSGLTAENRAQIMQQMPAESIKEIEVITNPSAKFSPEGTAGVINLVMKENRQAGYFGSVNVGMSYALAAPWKKAPGANAGFNLNFNKGIVDGYVNLGYHFRSDAGHNHSERTTYADSANLVPMRLQDTEGNQTRQGGGIFARAGLNFQLASHSSLGISGFGIISEPTAMRSKSDNTTHYMLQDLTSGDTLRIWEREQHNRSWHPGGNAMLTYGFKLRRHKLDISAAYYNFGFNMDNRYCTREGSNALNEQDQQSRNRDQSVEIKADYEWKPTDNSRLEAGYQANMAWRKTNSSATNGQGEEIYDYYSDFRNTEQTHALYVSYGNKFFERLSIMVGLRGEIFKRHLDSYSKDKQGNIRDNYADYTGGQDTTYFQLYPSAFIGYDFGKGNELQLNYTRRVERPRGHQINPAQNFSDSTNISQGNPALLPTYSSNMELNYLKTWERHSLSIGAFWRYKDGIVQNITMSDEQAGIFRNTYINANKRHEVGGDITTKNRFFGQVMQMTTSVELYYNRINRDTYTYFIGDDWHTITLPQQSAFTWSAKLQFNFMFTKTFTGQISARYRSPRVLAQGRTEHSYNIDLGLRKTFLDRKLALSLNVRDLLNSRARRSETWGDGFSQKSLNQWNSRTISLTLTYNFGNMKRKRNEKINDNNSRMSDDGFDDGAGESGWNE